MKKLLFMAFALLFFAETALALEITEVFPNPYGDDNNKEFVEIYTSESLNLSEYIIGDETSNDTLVALSFGIGTYALVVEEGFAWQELNTTASVYSAGATIGNNLGNTQDSVFLYAPSGILVDSLHYSEITEGYSFEKNEGIWKMSTLVNGSPGFTFFSEEIYNETIETNTPLYNESLQRQKETARNETLTNIVSLSFSLPSLLYANQSLASGFRIENKHDEKIDALLTYTLSFNDTLLVNETKHFFNISKYKTKDTVSFTFPSAGNYTLCGSVESLPHDALLDDNTICLNLSVVMLQEIPCNRTIRIFMNQTNYRSGQSIDFSLLVDGEKNPEFPFLASYFIEEITGTLVKYSTNITNTGIKHWTPKIKKEYGVYRIHATLLDAFCADATVEDNHATATFFVFNRFDEEPFVAIEHLYLGNDGSAKTGDTLRAKIQFYTGNLSSIASDEQTIRLYVKNKIGTVVSPVTQITPSESFEENTITLPLVLDYSCTSFPTTEESYILVVEGAGNTAKQKFPVRGVNKDRCGGASSEYPSYELASLGYTGENVSHTITIVNSDDSPHTYSVSSKIYKKAKTYSGDHFMNQQVISLNPGEDYTVTLQNTLIGMEAGEYSVKIQIQKDQQKTLKEFRGALTVVGTPLTVEEQSQETAEITAFRVLGSFSDEQIPLFVQIEGDGNYTLSVESPLEEKEFLIFLGSSDFIFMNITPLKGKNVFVARLYHNTTLIDTAALSFSVTRDTIITAKETKEPHEEIPPPSSPLAAVTGYAVYQHAVPFETTFYKTIALLNAVLLGTLFLLLLYVLKKNKIAVQNLLGQNKPPVANSSQPI